MYLFAARGDMWVWLCSAFDRGTTCPDIQCLTIVLFFFGIEWTLEREEDSKLYRYCLPKSTNLQDLEKWVQKPDWSHELKMTPNLTVHTEALLRGRGSLVGEKEILGAHTKQIRRRYWREGGSIFQPTPQLPHEKDNCNCLTCPPSICKSQGSAECS